MKDHRAAAVHGGSVLLLGWAALICVSSGPGTAQAGSASFPLRSEYKEVATIETEDLARRLDKVTIVDVRSKYEYGTLHIKSALSIPVSDTTFVDQVRKLRAKDAKPIVFYCNGVTCRKSYDAGRMAHIYHIANTLTYDAGMDAWAQRHPERCVLLGRSPVKPGDLISHKDFETKLLEPKVFAAKIGPSALVLDIRDANQRRSRLFANERWAQLDEHNKLDQAAQEAIRGKKTLLVYDQVGRQVQWFEYYLKSKGVKDYYFMKGGAEAYQKIQPPTEKRAN